MKPPKLKRIAVYCGASPGKLAKFSEAAAAMGKLLAERKLDLVYGGGRVGLMGTIADSVLSHGGHVIGVIPKQLMLQEVVHQGLPDLRVVTNMHRRKALMASLADGFIAMPGGFGTLEELFEVLTWGQLGWHTKPTGLLNIAGYYDPLIKFLERTVADGFLRQTHMEMVLVDSDPARLLQKMQEFKPGDVSKVSEPPKDLCPHCRISRGHYIEIPPLSDGTDKVWKCFDNKCNPPQGYRIHPK